MAIDTSMSAQASQSGATDAQTNKLLRSAQLATSDAAGTKEDGKIKKAASDFESILLGSWLQQAESSFASVPGGDEDDDPGSGKEQFQGIAMQALAGSLTKSGGIGIAKMIAKNLHSAASEEKTQSSMGSVNGSAKFSSIAAATQPASAKSKQK